MGTDSESDDAMIELLHNCKKIDSLGWDIDAGEWGAYMSSRYLSCFLQINPSVSFEAYKEYCLLSKEEPSAKYKGLRRQGKADNCNKFTPRKSCQALTCRHSD